MSTRRTHRAAPQHDHAGAAGVVVVLGVCAVVRLLFLTSPAGFMNGDEAATGVAAQDILRGHLTAFFPGQAYMGTLEQYVQAAFLAVLPDTALTLRLTQLLIHCATALVIIRIAEKCGLGRWRSLFAGLLFAVGPYYLIEWGSRSQGAYAASLLIGALGLLVAIDAHESPRPVHRAAVFGLLCGLGLWENPQVAYLLAPAGIWLLTSWRGQWLRSAGAFLGAFVVGVAPILLYAARHGLVPGLIGIGDPNNPSSTLQQRWSVLYDPVLAEFLGFRLTPNAGTVANWFPDGPLTLAAIGGAGAAIWAYRVDLARIVRLRADRRRLALVVACFAVAPVLYVTSTRAEYGAEPRYLWGLYPALFVGVAALVPARRRSGVIVGSAFIALTIGLTIRDHHIQPPVTPSAEDARHADAFLETHGQAFVWANYWQAGTMQFYAGEHLTVSALSPQRFESRALDVAAAPNPTYAAYAGDDAATVEHALRAHEVTFTQTQFGTIVLFTGLQPALQPWQLGVAPKPA